MNKGRECVVPFFFRHLRGLGCWRRHCQIDNENVDAFSGRDGGRYRVSALQRLCACDDDGAMRCEDLAQDRAHECVRVGDKNALVLKAASLHECSRVN